MVWNIPANYEGVKHFNSFNSIPTVVFMNFRTTTKAIKITLLLVMLAATASIPLADLWIKKDTTRAVFFDAESIPSEKVGLILGCGKNVEISNAPPTQFREIFARIKRYSTSIFYTANPAF